MRCNDLQNLAGLSARFFYEKKLYIDTALGNARHNEIMRKNPHAVALGRLGGRVGGKSTSLKKQRAARRNGKLNRGSKANEARREEEAVLRPSDGRPSEEGATSSAPQRVEETGQEEARILSDSGSLG
jgi:hypothetical protein